MKIDDIGKLEGKTFSYDTETNGLHWWDNMMIGAGFHCPSIDLRGYVYTCDYADTPYGKPKSKKVWLGEYFTNPATGRPNKLWVTQTEQKTRLTAIPDPKQRERLTEVLGNVCSNPKTCIVMHNAKFDLHFTGLDLWDLPCKLVDTSVMVHLYDSRLRKSLDEAERTFLGTASKRSHVTEAASKWKEPWLWEPDQIADYCVNDCVVTYQLAETLMPKLRDLRLNRLYAIQMTYIKALWRMERRGIQVNKEFCVQAAEKFGENLAAMEQDFYEAIGKEINWQSPAQLSKAIYEGLGIPKPVNPFLSADGIDHSRHAHGGKYQSHCTSSFILMEKINHPLGGQIMGLRETAKLRKAVQLYVELMDEYGFCHSNFNQTGTRTGRLSSREPNLQNVASSHRVRETQSTYTGGSIREDVYNLRQAFEARPGYTLISCDHAQQEIRLFAILAEEPYMIQALKDRLDIHLMIAKKVWGDCGPVQNKLHREL